MTLEECRGKWKVSARERVWRFFEKRGLRQELGEELRGLEEALNHDPAMILRLLRERRVVAARIPVRRYRLRIGGVWWRLTFAVDADNCEILFLDVEKRDEESYKKLRRRLR